MLCLPNHRCSAMAGFGNPQQVPDAFKKCRCDDCFEEDMEPPNKKSCRQSKIYNRENFSDLQMTFETMSRMSISPTNESV